MVKSREIEINARRRVSNESAASVLPPDETSIV